MQLQQVHRRALEAGEAARQAVLDPRRDVAQVIDVEIELGGQVGRRAGLGQQPAQRFLRLAVAVLRRGVDPVDAARQRAADRLALRGVVLVHQDAAHGAAAEDDFRDFDLAAAEPPSLHEPASP
ncbi:hypothetical protein D3C83_49290 [compost metagenome]